MLRKSSTYLFMEICDFCLTDCLGLQCKVEQKVFYSHLHELLQWVEQGFLSSPWLSPDYSLGKAEPPCGGHLC